MTLIIGIIAFILAITIHEAAHAWMADKLGDPTARLMGRLSLNPIVHYDPVGTTMLMVLVFMREVLKLPVIPFGWAKPVIFDPYNLKNPRRDSALISFAGPLANMSMAVVLSLILRILPGVSILVYALTPVIFLNVILAFFNLVPIHPLDGGKIFVGLLPEKEAYEADLFLKRYGIIILLFLIFPTIGGTSPLFSVLGPIVNFMVRLLIPGNPLV